jgi:uncharacterized membrane protein YedE/YeeE
MAVRIVAALLSGVLFGAGLALSGMMNPAKVLNFLDLAGTWDPSLALVMGGALAVATPAFALARRARHPLFAMRFELPAPADPDPRLLGGAALFGLGWGLVGICPGPAIALLSSGLPAAFLFFAAMLAGMLLYRPFAPA